jgi:hypothetical protein
MRLTLVGLGLLAGSAAFGQTNAPVLPLGNGASLYAPLPQAKNQFLFPPSPKAGAITLPPATLSGTTQLRDFSLRSSLAPTAKVIPIPTQWPNAKMEAIPTQWPNLKVVPIGSQAMPFQGPLTTTPSK